MQLSAGVALSFIFTFNDAAKTLGNTQQRKQVSTCSEHMELYIVVKLSGRVIVLLDTLRARAYI
eukprot:1160771-Pelagomonas_calceolata.AAC.4